MRIETATEIAYIYGVLAGWPYMQFYKIKYIDHQHKSSITMSIVSPATMLLFAWLVIDGFIKHPWFVSIPVTVISIFLAAKLATIITYAFISRRSGSAWMWSIFIACIFVLEPLKTIGLM